MSWVPNKGQKEAIVALRVKLCRAKVVQIRPNHRWIVLVTSSFWLFITSQPLLYCKGMFPASAVPRPSQPRCSTQHLGAQKSRMCHAFPLTSELAPSAMCRLMFLFMYKSTYTSSCQMGSVTLAQELGVGFRPGCRCLIRQLFQGHTTNPFGIRHGCRNPTYWHSCPGSNACRISDFQKVHIAGYV